MIEGLAEKLKVERKKRKLTQLALSEIVGITKATVSLYEKGDSTPSAEVLLKLAQLYNLSVDYLLGIPSENALKVDLLTDDQVEVVKSVIDAFAKANE